MGKMLYIFRGHALRTAFGIMMLALLLAGGASALSNNGGGSWLYINDITINNPSTALSDYQVLVTLDSSNFQFSQAQANGNDIRFTGASGAELYYWIESWDSGRAKIWVKVPSISEGGTITIQMWYGNPEASSSSNGNAIFEFFDDFSEDTIGINWIRPAGTGATIVGGQAKIPMAFNDDGYIYTTMSYKRPLIIESRVKSNYASQSGNFLPFSIDYNDGFEYWKNSYGFAEYDNKLAITKTGGGIVATVSQTTVANKYYILSAVLSSSNIIAKLYNDERSLLNSVSFDDSNYDNKRIMLDAYGANDGYSYHDWIFVRKYAFIEPSISVGVQNPVDSAGPITSDVIASPNPESINFGITLTALSSDETTGGSIISSAEYNIDGGSFVGMSAQDGAFDDITEEVTTNIGPFAEAGVHEVCVRSTDSAGNVGDQECTLLAVYDPSAGFVTGGGWINSPSGSYTPQNPNDPDLMGKATFGFVAKYQKGANIPTGSTEFQFKVADLNFHSTAYEWLVVAGTRAQYKGTGTINGLGEYGFMLTAIDGTPDSFRIKIINKANDEIVYDNKHGSSDIENDATELGGGSIIIHTK